MNIFNVLRIHLYIILIVSAISFPLTYIFLSSYEIIMRSTLLILLVNNLMLVILGVTYIRVNLFTSILLLFAFFNAILGIINNGISVRFFIDVFILFLFILKISLIAILARKENIYYLLCHFVKLYVYISAFAAIIGVILFYTIPSNANAYVGLTPVIIPLLIFSLIKSKYFLSFLSFLIVILSGKRAMVLSSLIVTMKHFITKRYVSLKISRIFILVLISIFIVISFKSFTLPAVDKILMTLNSLKSIDLDIIYNLIGPRFSEIFSISSVMNFYDLPLGKGAGFTYDLIHNGEVINYNHANAHFTPIGIISKYGFPIFLMLSLIFFRALIFKSENSLVMFIKLYLIAFIIESFFSYLIFNDRIIQVLLGLIFFHIKFPQSNLKFDRF